jgi:hypothetical protein
MAWVIKPTSSVSSLIPQIHSRNGVFSISFLYFASQRFLRQMLANPSKISNSPSTLADIVLTHCAYFSYYDLVDLSSPTIHTAEANRCEICLFKPASIDSTILQVNLDYSHHISTLAASHAISSLALTGVLHVGRSGSRQRK